LELAHSAPVSKLIAIGAKAIVKISHAVLSAAAAALLCLSPFTAFADKPHDKLGRGAAGVFLGFLEIPGTMWETKKRDGLPMALTLGWMKGIGYGVTRACVGLYEMLTFPFAGAEEYQPVVWPPFPWDRFRLEKIDLPEPQSLSYPVPRGKMILGTPPAR
jgi:putative exosortase-associated protein (TIGR04073 family)